MMFWIFSFMFLTSPMRFIVFSVYPAASISACKRAQRACSSARFFCFLVCCLQLARLYHFFAIFATSLDLFSKRNRGMGRSPIRAFRVYERSKSEKKKVVKRPLDNFDIFHRIAAIDQFN